MDKLDERYLGRKGEYKTVIDPRMFVDESKHETFRHNEPAMMIEIMANIGSNYDEWKNDGIGTIPVDGMIFLAKRMLQNYEKYRNPLDIIRLIWYAMCILRYGNNK